MTKEKLTNIILMLIGAGIFLAIVWVFLVELLVRYG